MGATVMPEWRICRVAGAALAGVRRLIPHGRAGARVDRYDENPRARSAGTCRRLQHRQACCARWARDTPAAIAIRWEHEDGRTAPTPTRDLQREANRLAHALRGLGVGAATASPS